MEKPDAATADQFELPPPLPWEEHFDASESDEDEPVVVHGAKFAALVARGTE